MRHLLHITHSLDEFAEKRREALLWFLVFPKTEKEEKENIERAVHNLRDALLTTISKELPVHDAKFMEFNKDREFQISNSLHLSLRKRGAS